MGNVEQPLNFTQMVEARQSVVEQRKLLSAQLDASNDLTTDNYKVLTVEYNNLTQQQIRYGEAIGEVSGKSYGGQLSGSVKYETKLPGSNAKQGTFDQVYQYTINGQTRVMIVEAKGGNHAKLGTRYNHEDARRYQQGHPEYTNSVISNMNEAYESRDRTRMANDPVYAAEVVNLGNTIDLFVTNRNKIDYTVVHQKFDTNNNSNANGHVDITQFDQTITNGN